MLRTTHRTRLMGAYALAILAVAFVGCGGGESSSPAGAQETAGTKPPRTVFVFKQEPLPSPSANILHAGLEKGALPGDRVKATVLTDEDCAPDQQGISHCRNVVRLASGQTLVLRHPHNMNLVLCLAPGEKVVLRKGDAHAA